MLDLVIFMAKGLMRLNGFGALREDAEAGHQIQHVSALGKSELGTFPDIDPLLRAPTT